MTEVDDLVEVTFIHDPALGSPPELASLGGKVFGVPPERIPLPARGKLLGQRGYSRQTPGGAWEWVLQGDTDPVDQFVDALTGRPGWLVPDSRTVVVTMIKRMFSAGIPRATIQNQVPQFYAAIAAEIRAEDAPPPGP